jgi:hypothetical protein
MRQSRAAESRPQLEALLQRLLIVFFRSVFQDYGVVPFPNFAPLLGFALPFLWDLDKLRRRRRLGYFYPTSWVATRLRAIHNIFYKMTLQFERKYSTQGSGASCHMSFGFFFGFCGIFLAKLQMDPQPEFRTQPKARGLLHMECNFAIALPYQLRLQDSTGIVEDLQDQHSRTLGATREDFRIAQTSAGVHSSLGMLQLFLSTTR